MIVELHPAWVWDCDGCGTENFERSVVGYMSEEELQEMKEDHGIEVWECGGFHTMPEVVTCKACGRFYSTEGYDE